MNGALYRGLRPVMWSPVEKTALAEAEIEYHDHTSTTIWVRFPVISVDAQDLRDASILIWTTTPWTMPGNRAIACGAEIDYALVRVDDVTPGGRARAGEKLLVALALLPQLCAAAGIATHHVLRAGEGCGSRRHRLRPSAARPRLRLRRAGACRPIIVTTDAGTGFVHIAPGHGEEDFLLGRAHGLEVPDTVGPDGTFNAWVPLFAGIHVYKAAEPICAALTEAAGVARARQARAFLPAFLAFPARR